MGKCVFCMAISLLFRGKKSTIERSHVENDFHAALPFYWKKKKKPGWRNGWVVNSMYGASGDPSEGFTATYNPSSGDLTPSYFFLGHHIHHTHRSYTPHIHTTLHTKPHPHTHNTPTAPHIHTTQTPQTCKNKSFDVIYSLVRMSPYSHYTCFLFCLAL